MNRRAQTAEAHSSSHQRSDGATIDPLPDSAMATLTALVTAVHRSPHAPSWAWTKWTIQFWNVLPYAGHKIYPGCLTRCRHQESKATSAWGSRLHWTTRVTSPRRGCSASYAHRRTGHRMMQIYKAPKSHSQAQSQHGCPTGEMGPRIQQRRNAPNANAHIVPM